MSRQKEYTFDDLLGGRSARYCAAQYGKLTAHSSRFERGALELVTTILGHYSTDFLQKSIFWVIWKYFKVSKIFTRKIQHLFSLSKILDIGR